MAQKEAVNTFTGGMIMDTHPLTTPNNVLTNCLNGTLVTFNGNEMILQNDLGNTKIELNQNGDCVKLPDGFVPVGTTELGGIIYISSFNPETKECQIGCFPSPERNLDPQNPEDVENEFDIELLLGDSTINYTKIKNGDDPIQNQSGTINNLIKGSIRFDLTTEELHAGDEYTITIDNNLQDISNLGYEFKLVSVSEDGNIMELNFESFGHRYFYNAPASGKLSMLIYPKKLTSFSVTYSDLIKNGQYTQEMAPIEEYSEIERIIPNTYNGDYVKVYQYNYYELQEGYTTIYDGQTLNTKRFVKVNSPDFSQDYPTLPVSVYDGKPIYETVNNVSTFYRKGYVLRYDNKDYVRQGEEGNYYFESGNPNINNINSDQVGIIKLESDRFKVKVSMVHCYVLSGTKFNVEPINSNTDKNFDLLYIDDYTNIILKYQDNYYAYTSMGYSKIEEPTAAQINDAITLTHPQFILRLCTPQYYNWQSSGWSVKLKNSWNNKNKEEKEIIKLEGVVINNILYKPISQSDDNLIVNLSGLEKPQGSDYLTLLVYPVVKLDNNKCGYIEELVQSVIIDPTLQKGQVKLSMWKYYCTNEIVNLQYGFAGQLEEDQEITSITISALEYKNYKTFDNSRKEIQVIKLYDLDSYLGSFSEEIALGITLDANKLYAVTIKIETNYSSPIYEYRWLYTSDAFNDQFNSSVLDYDKQYLTLNKLECNIEIGGSKDTAYKQENEELITRAWKNISGPVSKNPDLQNYSTYGYTKTEYDDNIPYSFVYKTNDSLFNLKDGLVDSEIVEINTGDMITPYSETEPDREVLNSFKGQKVESGTSEEIYTSKYKYRNYTDYLEVKDWDNENIHISGRIYNKIKGTIGQTEKEGQAIFRSLVYDETTANDFNLVYDRATNKILPKYYLCIETNPPVKSFHDGWIDWADCTAAYYGRVSEFRTQLKKYGNNDLRFYHRNTYSDINDNYSDTVSSTDTKTGRDIDWNNTGTLNNGGHLLHEKVIEDLQRDGITKCNILPVIFTKLYGAIDDISSNSGNSDRWKDGTYQAINLKVGQDVNTNDDRGYIQASRNYNTRDQLEIALSSNSGYHLYGTIGILTDTGRLYILYGNIEEITANSLDKLSKRIFNLVSQVFIKSGTTDAVPTYYLTDYDWQQDYYLKQVIYGKIKVNVKTPHLVVDQCEDPATDNYSKWSTNNLMISSFQKIYDFNTYKLFYVEQRLVDTYENQTYGKVFAEETINNNIISCFSEVTAPDDPNLTCYVINGSHKLVSINGPFTLQFNLSTITVNSKERFECTYGSLGESKDFLTFDANDEQFYLNTTNIDSQHKIIINNKLGAGSDELLGHSLAFTQVVNKKL